MTSATLYHYHLDRGSVVIGPGKTEAFQISGTTELTKSVDGLPGETEKFWALPVGAREHHAPYLRTMQISAQP
jgi:hypothetical protein